jgi:phosphatidylglycerophosphatase A
LVIFFAFTLLFAPLKVVADIIPPLGWLVGFGTGLLAAMLTLVLAPVIIAIAWLTFRPLLAGAIILVGLALAFALFRLFDIWKPGPVRMLDRQKNPAGVMGDDIMAGAMAGLVLLLLQSMGVPL